MATKASLLRDVRVILDENENLRPLLESNTSLLPPFDESGPDDMALERDTLLATLIAPAIDKVHKLATGKMLGNVAKRLTGLVWDKDKYCQWSVLPNNVLFLTYVRLGDWERSVTSFITEYGNEYDICRSGIEGVMPSNEFPACAIMPYESFEPQEEDTEPRKSTMRLEAYPIDTTNKSVVMFVEKTDDAEKEDSFDYPIGDECYWAVVYTIASLYYLSADNRQRADDMAKEAAEILNVER